MLLKRIASRSQKAFTLIELLVVIAIIGILASIILASLATAQAKGRDARRVSDIKEIQLALDLYYDANGYYPPNMYGTPSPLVTGGYISAVPSDPQSSAPCTTDGTGSGGLICYQYVPLCSSPGVGCNANSYHLGAVLELTGNAAVASDSDACPGSSANQGTACSSNPTVYGNGIHDYSPATGYQDFFGVSANCGSSQGTLATDKCFDATP